MLVVYNFLFMVPNKQSDSLLGFKFSVKLLRFVVPCIFNHSNKTPN